MGFSYCIIADLSLRFLQHKALLSSRQTGSWKLGFFCLDLGLSGFDLIK
jgi:hypothetical protein